MLYSYQRNYPKPLPERIRLSNGDTRTDSSTFTEEDIVDAGYVLADETPTCDASTHKVTWDSTSWLIVELTQDELNAVRDEVIAEIRQIREDKIKEVEWRVMRNLSEVRLGLPTTDDIADLDSYIQAWRDITSQGGTSEVIFPILAGE